MPVLRRLVEGAQRGTQQPATAGRQSGNRVVRLRRNERLSQVEFEKQVWPSAGKVNHAVNGRPSSADDPNRALTTERRLDKINLDSVDRVGRSLQMEQLGVLTTQGHQFIVSALLDDRP